MAVLYLDGKRLKRLILASAKWLLANEKELNDINVYPVPDGDTGTNMGATLKSIVQSISDSDLGDHLPHVANKAANAALMGARGNSGVILSQIFKGFSEGINNKRKLNGLDIAYSLKKAYEKAYSSIADPVEGTILTVVREGVDAAYKKAKKEADIILIMETLLSESKRSLENTPNLLPVLKEAGVVDAGAMGFVYLIEGIYMLLKGHSLPEIDIDSKGMKKKEPALKQDSVINSFYGYCNEFFLHGKKINAEKIKKKLLTLGDSLVIGEADDLLKIHIHSKAPHKIMEECLKYGILTDIKVENMDKQHAERGETAPAGKKKGKTKKETVFIAVALGEGVKKIFESLGCDYVIKGGQTMNPSVEELNSAVEQFDAENYILLPNNSNVIFTAEQISEINKKKNIIVIPTQSIPQGFSTLIAYNPEYSIDENIHNMKLSIKNIKTGEITKAVKDSSINKIKIKKGDIIGLYNNSIINTYSDTDSAVIELVRSMLDKDNEVISIFYGQDVSEEEAGKIENKIKKAYNNMEVEVHHGGQPHYYYIISVE